MVLRNFDPVAVRWRDGDDQERRFGGGVVEDPVRDFGRDFQAVLSSEHVGLAVDLNGKCASKDEKELAGASVMMRDFGRARWHAFLNDAQFMAARQVPAIAGLTPDIMLGGAGGDGVH